MTIDDAIATLRAMDQASEEAFSPAEREAIIVLGTAGWSGEIEPNDPRLASLPEVIAEMIRAMQAKRIVQ